MTLAAIYLSRVGVVGSVFAAALTVWTAVVPPVVAALFIGVGPCWGETCGDMLEAMARIAPWQPNDAMAQIASRRNRTISLDPNLPGPNSRERFYCHVDIVRGALAKRTRYDRVDEHPRALEPGSRYHILRGGTLPPNYSWQQP